MKGQEKRNMIMRNSLILAFFLCSFSASSQEKTFSYTPLIKLTYLDYKPSISKVDTLSSLLLVKDFNYQKVYDKSLGFFCRTENKASKKAGVQMRMRLGNLEYVDRMEGKIK